MSMVSRSLLDAKSLKDVLPADLIMLMGDRLLEVFSESNFEI